MTQRGQADGGGGVVVVGPRMMCSVHYWGSPFFFIIICSEMYVFYKYSGPCGAPPHMCPYYNRRGFPYPLVCFLIILLIA